jgi:hypothetical protein
MHELLIGLLIIVIVAIQTYVFSITLKKIKIFKNILPNQENFKTIKVYIKESDIETIELVDIFNEHSAKSNLGDKINIIENVKSDIKNYQENEQLKINLVDEVNENQILFIIEANKKTLIINQEVNVKYTINRDADNFTPQPFDGFKLINGPKLDVSQSWLNGNSIYSKSYSYVLKPLKTGDLVIRKAFAKFNEQVYESNSITISVKEY